jgi:hypothetical protein
MTSHNGLQPTAAGAIMMPPRLKGTLAGPFN